MTRRRVVVHGRVQGVFFRGSTVERAREVGVNGWVRNRPDGTVEAVFEGSAEQVAEMVRYCRQGPPWARVERIEEFEEAPEDLGGFGLR
jgi:acylphosphatase